MSELKSYRISVQSSVGHGYFLVENVWLTSREVDSIRQNFYSAIAGVASSFTLTTPKQTIIVPKAVVQNSVLEIGEMEEKK